MGSDQRALDLSVVSNVIRLLEHVSRVPGMYLGEVNLLAAMHYLTGFTNGLQSGFDIQPLHAVRLQALQNRGYVLPRHALHELPDRICDRFSNEQEAAVERLAIELEAWKLLNDSMKETSAGL
jgi:hypothetical protein